MENEEAARVYLLVADQWIWLPGMSPYISSPNVSTIIDVINMLNIIEKEKVLTRVKAAMNAKLRIINARIESKRQLGGK